MNTNDIDWEGSNEHAKLERCISAMTDNRKGKDFFWSIVHPFVETLPIFFKAARLYKSSSAEKILSEEFIEGHRDVFSFLLSFFECKGASFDQYTEWNHSFSFKALLAEKQIFERLRPATFFSDFAVECVTEMGMEYPLFRDSDFMAISEFEDKLPDLYDDADTESDLLRIQIMQMIDLLIVQRFDITTLIERKKLEATLKHPDFTKIVGESGAQFFYAACKSAIHGTLCRFLS